VTCSWWGKCSKCGRFDMLGAPVTLTIPEGLLQMYEKMAEAPHDSHTWMNGQDGESHGMCADCKAKQLEQAAPCEKEKLN